MPNRAEGADIQLTVSTGNGVAPVRLCAVCANPERPLGDEHANRRFHPDCYKSYRRFRNAQYKRAERGRGAAPGDYSGVMMTVRAVTLPGRAVMELTVIASRLQDQARLMSAESWELMDTDDKERMVAFADRILTEAEVLHQWLMDQLPHPILNQRATGDNG